MADKIFPVAMAVAVSDSQSDTTQEKEKEKEMGQGILERVKSATSWKDPGPPPDGGVRAWTQVLVGHLVIMNTW